MTSPIWHPFTQHGLGVAIPTVVSAEGAALYTADGRRIIDAISSWWVTTHGHRNRRIMAAIAEQTTRLDQIIFAGWSHEPAESVAAALLRLMPIALTRVFFSDSGSTSVEVALKMALGYWLNRGEPRHRILMLEHGYHGDTIGAMSVGERGAFNQAYTPLLFDVGKIPFPVAGAQQATLDALEKACRTAPAALIVEPLVVGAGGMLIYPARVLAEMRAICARHNVLFIADEVMTAWGRTGTLLACEQASIVPDILCLSKGLTGGALPLAVTMAIEPIYEAHYSFDRSRMFFHSSSYTANPVACAAAAANIAIWEEEPVLARITDLAARQRAQCDQIRTLRGINNARTLGTIVAVDVGSGTDGYLSNVAPQLIRYFNDQNLLLRPLGSTVYVMPPYCVSDADLNQIYAAVAEAAETVDGAAHILP